MWEGSRGHGRDERRGGEGGVQSPLAERFFWEVLGLISRTWTLLPAPRAPLSQGRGSHAAAERRGVSDGRMVEGPRKGVMRDGVEGKPTH